MDQETEQRVWERVSGKEQELAGLRNMELSCRESAAVFHQLAASASGERRERLQGLMRRESGNAMALRGMQVLDGEEPEPIHLPPQKNAPRRALAQSFRRSQKAQKDYTAHIRGSEYGAVFSQMADDERAVQAGILALLGEWGK